MAATAVTSPIDTSPPLLLTTNFDDTDNMQHHALADVTSLEDLVRLGGAFDLPTAVALPSPPDGGRLNLPLPTPPELKIASAIVAPPPCDALRRSDLPADSF